MFYCHHEAGGAEAALGASPVAVGFLDCSQRPVLAYAFDGGDLLAFATGGEHGARKHRSAVNQHGAGAAGGVVASALGAGEVEFPAQRIEQESVRLDGDLVRARVDAELEELFFHVNQSSAISHQSSGKPGLLTADG